MATLRRSIVFLESNCYRISNSRSLHVTHRLEAQGRRAPAVRRQARAAAQPVPVATRVTAPSNPDDFLPPTTLLRTAKMAGALSTEPAKAITFLTAFHERHGSSSNEAGWEQQLCHEHGITTKDMITISGILRSRRAPAQHALAKNLLLSASAMGDKSATFDIIQSALNGNKLHEYPTVLQRLGILAKTKEDPASMALLAKVLISRGKEEEAFAWIQRSLENGVEFGGSGEALVNLGRMLLQKGDREGAQAAFIKAAIDLDEPYGYFYLAKFQPPGSTNEEVYLLKAASSGVIEAAHNLGALYLAQLEKEPTTLDEYGMAREWFLVAANGGFGLSMLNLALMCKAVGKIDEGSEWLDKAEQVPEVADEARKTRKQWSVGKKGQLHDEVVL